MIGIEIKAFILSKKEKVSACQDSYAINLAEGRFAIADGVSRSYHPEFVAQKLCRDYVKEGFPDVSIPTLLRGLYEDWDSRSSAFESALTEEKRERALSRRNSIPPGASTFAFLHVNCLCSIAEFHVLGDSSIIYSPINGDVSFYNSNVSQDEDGNQIVSFDNYPMFVCANGASRGEIRHGTFPLEAGYLVLATDSVASWIYETMKEEPDLMDSLWAIKNNDTFAKLATDCRSVGKMDNDLTLMILRINKVSCPYIINRYLFEVPPVSLLEGLFPLPSLLLPDRVIAQDEMPGIELDTKIEEPSDKDKSTSLFRRIFGLWK